MQRVAVGDVVLSFHVDRELVAVVVNDLEVENRSLSSKVLQGMSVLTSKFCYRGAQFTYLSNRAQPDNPKSKP